MGCPALTYHPEEKPHLRVVKNAYNALDIAQRFISTDPLKDDYPQLNPYNYAGNRPITEIDIDGLQSSGDEKRGPQTHEVQKGDTYSAIAEQYGVSVDQLRAWNGYEDTQIPIGANLVVSSLEQQEETSPSPSRKKSPFKEFLVPTDQTNIENPSSNKIEAFQKELDKEAIPNGINLALERINTLPGVISGVSGGTSSLSKSAAEVLDLPPIETNLRLKSIKGSDVPLENTFLGKRGEGRLRIKPGSNIKNPNPVKTNLKGIANFTGKVSTVADVASFGLTGLIAINEYQETGSFNNAATGSFLFTKTTGIAGLYFPATGAIVLLGQITLLQPSFRKKILRTQRDYTLKNSNRFRQNTPELSNAIKIFFEFGGDPKDIQRDMRTFFNQAPSR